MSLSESLSLPDSGHKFEVLDEDSTSAGFGRYKLELSSSNRLESCYELISQDLLSYRLVSLADPIACNRNALEERKIRECTKHEGREVYLIP